MHSWMQLLASNKNMNELNVLNALNVFQMKERGLMRKNEIPINISISFNGNDAEKIERNILFQTQFQI